jgi:putative hydrolase of the HAD superfamily
VTAAGLERKGVRAIVFDLDGTLYQNAQMGEMVNLAACRYVAGLKGVTVARAGTLLNEARLTVSGTGGTLSRAVIALGGNLKDLHERFSNDVHPEGLLSIDGRVPQLLARLAARFELHIYTNNNKALSARIMREIGVTGLFQQVFTIEDYWLPKPEEVALLGILNAIGRKPEETLFVGDRYEVDLALPKSLGCAIFESCTIEQLLTLSQLLED